MTDGLAQQARLSPLGVEIAGGEILRALTNRLQIVAHRGAHPEVAAGEITRPIVIVGQPRTGTTILYDLLAQDPDLRPPLTWEVDYPCPPPQPETYHDDPRIAQTQATLEMSEQIIPGFLKFHPMGALRRAGVRADLRRRVHLDDLLGAVPAARLLPVAAL